MTRTFSIARPRKKGKAAPPKTKPTANGAPVRSERKTTSWIWHVPEGIRKSKEAFLRDLPQLLQKQKFRGKWVVYSGDRRLGVAFSQTALYRKCFQLGLNEKMFYVGMVCPHPAEPEEVDP